ncbi:MAG: hypothetical protein GF317_09325 [Candidatus Lokiarchaeota archaeon]|nr:hypothetical protein [Candidatus Lokiarchaeota archaeon]MBD3199912.1 hypothetical protein [Candidatus Lokiarchaeota archaeon]
MKTMEGAKMNKEDFKNFKVLNLKVRKLSELINKLEKLMENSGETRN